MLAPYLPILVLFVVATAFAAGSVLAAPLIGPRRYNRAKLVFDIEIIFLYPWAVANNNLGVFGLVEMVLFIGTVFIAYAYVWRRGGLDWD